MPEYISIKSRRSSKFEVDSSMFEHWDSYTANPRVIVAWMRCAAWSHKWGTNGIVSHNLVRGFAPGLKRMHGYDLWFTHHPKEKLWELKRFKEFTRRTQAPVRPPIPQETRIAVYERDGNKCSTCGTTENLSLDHIHPWSLGGPDTIDNLQTLCRGCNSKKGARVE